MLMKRLIVPVAITVVLFSIAGPVKAGSLDDEELIEMISFQVAPKLNYQVPVDAMRIRNLGGNLGRCFVVTLECNRREFLEIFYIGFLLGGLASLNVKDPIQNCIVRITVQYKEPETKFWVATVENARKLLNKEINVQYFINNCLIKI